MKRISAVFLCLVLMLFTSSVVSAGEVIGQLSDPVGLGIDEFVDITSAWVEKEGSSLTFIMELRGDIPDPLDLADPNANITYIWLVDADNNPNTGQSPGLVGSEFNVRVVISQTPHAGGFVDITGALSGGGLGSVQVTDNHVAITIDKSQIASPDHFHWRCDAAYWVPNQLVSYNGITAESGVAYTSPYGVIYENDSQSYSVEVSYSAFQCQPGSEDPQLADEVMNDYNNSQTDPIFLSIDGKFPPETPESYQILAQATGHAGFMHVRNFTWLDIGGAVPKAFGQSDATSIFDIRFTLYGPETSGSIPPDTFQFVFNHDYHVFGQDTEEQSHGWSYCQIVVTQLDPLTQKGLWVHQADMWNNDSFGKHEEIIDLADYGLEYGVLYTISGLLSDHAQSLVPTSDAESVSDATLTALIQVAPLPGDIDLDSDVDLADFSRMVEYWLMSR